MRQTGVVLLLTALLCQSAGAQDAPPPTPGVPPRVAGHARRAKPVPRTDSTAAAPTPVSAAERAARLAEGRRKFFEQQQGFETETPPTPATSVFPVGPNGLPIAPLALKRR